MEHTKRGHFVSVRRDGGDVILCVDLENGFRPEQIKLRANEAQALGVDLIGLSREAYHTQDEVCAKQSVGLPRD